MRIIDITEKYDPNHKCKTPGAQYSSTISGKKVSMSVKLPKALDVGVRKSENLESDLHYAFEKVLAKYLPKTT